MSRYPIDFSRNVGSRVSAQDFRAARALAASVPIAYDPVLAAIEARLAQLAATYGPTLARSLMGLARGVPYVGAGVLLGAALYELYKLWGRESYPIAPPLPKLPRFEPAPWGSHVSLPDFGYWDHGFYNVDGPRATHVGIGWTGGSGSGSSGVNLFSGPLYFQATSWTPVWDNAPHKARDGSIWWIDYAVYDPARPYAYGRKGQLWFWSYDHPGLVPTALDPSSSKLPRRYVGPIPNMGFAPLVNTLDPDSIPVASDRAVAPPLPCPYHLQAARVLNPYRVYQREAGYALPGVFPNNLPVGSLPLLGPTVAIGSQYALTHARSLSKVHVLSQVQGREAKVKLPYVEYIHFAYSTATEIIDTINALYRGLDPALRYRLRYQSRTWVDKLNILYEHWRFFDPVKGTAFLLKEQIEDVTYGSQGAILKKIAQETRPFGRLPIGFQTGPLL